MRHLVIGASSEIAEALIRQFLKQGDEVVAVSRSLDSDHFDCGDDQIMWFQSDYSEPSVKTICKTIKETGFSFDRVFICNGVLHTANLKPEKRLEEITEERLTEVMRINAFLPLRWVKHLKPLLRSKKPCIITAFSARIGSIGDNERGGWYAYRASKAALNMLMKNAAIEFRREARNVSFLLFHPGTTDTPLSKPFQKSVSQEKLFTPSFVATQLQTTLNSLDENQQIHFRDWANKPIDW